MTTVIWHEAEEQEITHNERKRWERRKLVYVCDECSTDSQTVLHITPDYDWKDLES